MSPNWWDAALQPGSKLKFCSAQTRRLAPYPPRFNVDANGGAVKKHLQWHAVSSTLFLGVWGGGGGGAPPKTELKFVAWWMGFVMHGHTHIGWLLMR